MNHHVLLTCVGVLLATLSSGCGHSFAVATPPGFVELEDQEPNYDFRATSANGLVIAVRELEHEPKGDKAFWVQAIQNRLRQMEGYALLSTDEVKAHGGAVGTRMRFGHDENARSHLYDIVLFLTEKRIYLLELGGEKSEFTKQQRYFDWVTENFRVDE